MPTIDNRRAILRERVGHWAVRLRVEPRLVRVREMSRKWGSCSTSGVVTIASDLADQEAGFQDFVIAHELLHLRVPNHGKLFKALMTAHVPDWRSRDLQRRKIAARPVIEAGRRIGMRGSR
jgi:predicted metal-dependent hydrolase